MFSSKLVSRSRTQTPPKLVTPQFHIHLFFIIYCFCFVFFKYKAGARSIKDIAHRYHHLGVYGHSIKIVWGNITTKASGEYYCQDSSGALSEKYELHVVRETLYNLHFTSIFHQQINKLISYKRYTINSSFFLFPAFSQLQSLQLY